MIITQNEYIKADLKEIDRVVAMVCNINRFERKITEREHKEILKFFDEFEKGCKVFFGVISNSGNIERHLEVAVLTTSKQILPISRYDESTGNFYIIERTFKDQVANKATKLPCSFFTEITISNF